MYIVQDACKIILCYNVFLLRKKPFLRYSSFIHAYVYDLNRTHMQKCKWRIIVPLIFFSCGPYYYFTCTEPVVKQSWGKKQLPYKSHLTFCKQTLAFSLVHWLRLKLGIYSPTRIPRRAVSHLPPTPLPSPQKGNDYFRSKK